MYDRTRLVEATIETVEKNLVEGALLVIAVLFLVLGNIRAAIVTACVIPLAMLFTITGMVETRVSANLMSLGAIDFGIIVDGAVIIVENCLRLLADRQRRKGGLLALRERLQTIVEGSGEVIKPSLFGTMIIAVVYLPVLTLTGVEGKMFTPMALTVLMALLGAAIFSMTFVPAAVAIFVTGRFSEKENFFMRGAKRVYLPLLGGAIRFPGSVVVVAVAIVVASAYAATRMGGEFIPSLDEGDIAVAAIRIPGTSLTQSVDLQAALEKRVRQIAEVKDFFARTGTAEVATDAMPPSISDGYVMLKPRAEWPDPARPKSDLVEEIEHAANEIPGSSYEISQPIQLRVNELISGVRSDIGIKIFGDDLDILQGAAKQVEAAIHGIRGATDVKTEQVAGLPILTVKIDRQALSRYGLSVAEVQNIVEIAIGGRTAGKLFEGDRRFDIVVRLPESLRGRVEAIRAIPIPLPPAEEGGAGLTRTALSSATGAQARYVPLSSVAAIETTPGPNQISRENGKRRIVVTANVRGRDLGSFVAEAQQAVSEKSQTAGGLLDRVGRAVRATGLRYQAADHRRAGGAAAGAAAAVHEPRLAGGRTAGFQRRTDGLDRRRRCAAAARHSALDQRRRGLHCAFRRRGAQWARHRLLHRAAAARRRSRARRGSGRCLDQAATGAHDGPRRFARLRADGNRDRRRRRGAASARYRRDRRHHLFDGADAARTAGALRSVPEGLRAGARSFRGGNKVRRRYQRR